jgi:hypothetical protein
MILNLVHNGIYPIAYDENNVLIHEIDNTNTLFPGDIIPDGQFDELIKNIKGNMIMGQVGLTQEDINRHKDERTAFKAENSKFYSPTLSKSWKKYTTWGGIKTRKYKKGKKGKNGKTRNYKKGKTKNRKSKKRNYK